MEEGGGGREVVGEGAGELSLSQGVGGRRVVGVERDLWSCGRRDSDGEPTDEREMRERERDLKQSPCRLSIERDDVGHIYKADLLMVSSIISALLWYDRRALLSHREPAPPSSGRTPVCTC